MSDNLWIQIKVLFPHGIEVKFRNDPNSSEDDVPTITKPFCLSCFEDPDPPKKSSESMAEAECNPPCIAAATDDSEVMIIEPPSTTFDLRVLEAREGSSIKDILNALALLHGNENQHLESSGGGLGVGNYLRRSTRKRKTSFPKGCLLDEETCRIDFSRNVASLRLSLLQICATGSNFQVDHTLYLIIAKRPKGFSISETILSDDYIVESLDYAKNAEMFRSVCENAASTSFNDSFDPSSSLTLVRVAEREPTILPDISKEEILDHFLSLAHGTEERKGKNKKTVFERGFNGTFLLTSNFGRNQQERPENKQPNTGGGNMKRKQTALDEDKSSFSDRPGSRSPELSNQNDDPVNTKSWSSPPVIGQAIDNSQPPSKPEEFVSKRVHAEKDGEFVDDTIVRKTILEDDSFSVGTSEMLDLIITALTENPDISKDKQNHSMIRLAAEQVRDR